MSTLYGPTCKWAGLEDWKQSSFPSETPPPVVGAYSVCMWCSAAALRMPALASGHRDGATPPRVRAASKQLSQAALQSIIRLPVVRSVERNRRWMSTAQGRVTVCKDLEVDIEAYISELQSD